MRGELTIIADRLGELISLFIQANGGNAIPLKPRPRPVTALERARDDRARAKHEALALRLIRTSSEEVR